MVYLHTARSIMANHGLTLFVTLQTQEQTPKLEVYLASHVGKPNMLPAIAELFDKEGIEVCPAGLHALPIHFCKDLREPIVRVIIRSSVSLHSQLNELRAKLQWCHKLGNALWEEGKYSLGNAIRMLGDKDRVNALTDALSPPRGRTEMSMQAACTPSLSTLTLLQ